MNKKMVNSRVFGIGAAALAAALAFAQTPAAAQARAGRAVTHERVMRSGGALFDRLDTNKDGVVDQAEYEKYVEEEVAKTRARLMTRFTEDDANKDAQISREEFLAGREKWFQEIDANKDGKLDEDEFQAARKARRKTGAPAEPQ